MLSSEGENQIEEEDKVVGIQVRSQLLVYTSF